MYAQPCSELARPHRHTAVRPLQPVRAASRLRAALRPLVWPAPAAAGSAAAAAAPDGFRQPGRSAGGRPCLAASHQGSATLARIKVPRPCLPSSAEGGNGVVRLGILRLANQGAKQTSQIVHARLHASPSTDLMECNMNSPRYFSPRWRAPCAACLPRGFTPECIGYKRDLWTRVASDICPGPQGRATCNADDLLAKCFRPTLVVGLLS